eukprot:TRINITY_DN4975_c0_g4_i3.p2 TRINITY_DN4975_c0_g4~~TRINITY_DN4975_c0_g4_i3.p2  ORF type:complete len:227 (+),score=27.38 TRINITY_DN4975_c0_g4_i3:98-778(+)
MLKHDNFTGNGRRVSQTFKMRVCNLCSNQIADDLYLILSPIAANIRGESSLILQQDNIVFQSVRGTRRASQNKSLVKLISTRHEFGQRLSKVIQSRDPLQHKMLLRSKFEHLVRFFVQLLNMIDQRGLTASTFTTENLLIEHAKFKLDDSLQRFGHNAWTTSYPPLEANSSNNFPSLRSKADDVISLDNVGLVELYKVFIALMEYSHGFGKFKITNQIIRDRRGIP